MRRLDGASAGKVWAGQGTAHRPTPRVTATSGGGAAWASSQENLPAGEPVWLGNSGVPSRGLCWLTSEAAGGGDRATP